MKTFVKVAVVAVGLFFTSSAVNAQQKFAHINSAIYWPFLFCQCTRFIPQAGNYIITFI